MVTCNQCSGNRLEEKRWVNVNTLELSDVCDEYEKLYCLDCGEHVESEGTFPDIFETATKYKRRKIKTK